jgi:hypothetical protein
MTCIIETPSKRSLSAKVAAGLAISAFLVLGMSAVPASAEEHRGDRHGDHRGWDDHGHHGWGWGGGYYRAPPVVYGSPYYAPPPVVYGPSVGVYLPGVSIGIR